MGEVFYIADTHYGHKNVMAFDGRPFNGHFRNWVHFYGHVHTTFEYDMIDDFRRDMIACGNPCRMYNIGAMMPWMNFTPRTFDEIISLSEHWLGNNGW